MAGSPYCSVVDVQALNFARSIGVGSNPGPSQVQTYINMTAGEIDAVLARRGIAVPVNIASWPQAFNLLNSVNAKGAWAMLEAAAPNSLNLDRAKAAYDEALKLLSDAKFAPAMDLDMQHAEPRAPWITFHPTGQTFDPQVNDIGGQIGDGISQGPGIDNNPANPFFSRQQRF